LIKLGVYSINPEHDLLLDDATYCYQNQPRPTFACQKRLHAFDPCQWRFRENIWWPPMTVVGQSRPKLTI
jgi:hypothetical protein